MKFFSFTIFSVLALASLSAQAATPIINLSVSGEVSPGVYGQIQLGNAPPPPVLESRPTIIVQQPPGRTIEPIYLHVPPGHAKNWSKHCREYNACNKPVYFVKSEEYEPGYREYKDKGHKDKGHKDKGRGHDD